MDEFTRLWRDFSKSGNPRLFQKIYNHHFQLVRFGAFKILKNAAASEDIAQDIFIKLYICRKRYPNVNNFSFWLNKITRNESIRKLQTDHLIATDDLGEFYKPDMSTEFQEEDYPYLLRTGIKLLKGKNYALILNLCLEEKNNHEIALILGKSEKYVRDRKVLAKNALKKVLRQIK